MVRHRLQLRFQSSKFGVQDWLKLLTSRQVLTLPGSELVVTRENCVLNAGLSAANCKHAFEMAGITLGQAVQYHPEILDGKFDDDGLLRPDERLSCLVPSGVLKHDVQVETACACKCCIGQRCACEAIAHAPVCTRESRITRL